jgi:hypothetical protein
MKSHTRTDPSEEPETMRRPSLENETDETSEVWPWHIPISTSTRSVSFVFFFCFVLKPDLLLHSLQMTVIFRVDAKGNNVVSLVGTVSTGKSVLVPDDKDLNEQYDDALHVPQTRKRRRSTGRLLPECQDLVGFFLS